MRIVVALGGNALLKRGQLLTAKNQRENVKVAARALAPLARERAALQLATHSRVREASRTAGRVSIEPILPVDILGAYVLLPRLS